MSTGKKALSPIQAVGYIDSRLCAPRIVRSMPLSELPSVSTRRVVVCAAAMLAIHGVIAGPFVLAGSDGLAPAHDAAFTGASLLLLITLVALSTVDWLTFRLPDTLTVPLGVAGIIVHWDGGQFAVVERLIAAGIGFCLLAGAARGYEKLRGRAGLGLGDAKLYAAAGAWLGLAGLPSVLVYATIGALAVIAVSMIAGRRVTLTSRLPFGPFLAFAIWIVWLYGPVGEAFGF
jgi:leader peptidase (prepilin peptidase) / N-methyltransferase